MTSADAIARAEQVLDYRFADPTLLHTALTHSSAANTRLASNERLEFLGDAVLGLVVCDALFQQFADWLEGDLTKVKSVVVSGRICAEISDEIGLTDLVISGKGVGDRRGLPPSLRAAVFEAVIGAMYVDGGIEPVRKFIRNHVDSHIERNSRPENQENYKSHLQQYAQRRLSATPHYEALDEQGPDHSKCFEICVVINGKRYPSAWGPNKKQAEQEAAKRALEALRCPES